MFGQDALNSIDKAKDNACNKASAIATDAMNTPNRVADEAKSRVDSRAAQGKELIKKPGEAINDATGKAAGVMQGAKGKVDEILNQADSFIGTLSDNKVAEAFGKAAALFDNLSADNPTLPCGAINNLHPTGLTAAKNTAFGALTSAQTAVNNQMATAKEAVNAVKEPIAAVKQKLKDFAGEARGYTMMAQDKVDSAAQTGRNSVENARNTATAPLDQAGQKLGNAQAVGDNDIGGAQQRYGNMINKT